MATIFVTGFPGFLGSALLPPLLARDAGTRAVCLVQGRYAAEAQARAASLEALHPHVAGRIDLVEGDITEPGLGLEKPLDGVTEVYHLAAVYDLAVERELAERVNVLGTRHVLDWAERLPSLRRVHYVSTCYVSGRWPGVFRESDLSAGQQFNNWYERTKHAAEVDVRQRMEAGLRCTVYRPAIVVGDSLTGETQKYDGPYAAMRLIGRQGRVAVMPVVGNTSSVVLNVVPRDFVVNALVQLSGLPHSVGVTYQLADPDAVTIAEMLRAIGQATGQRVLEFRLPYGIARWSLERLPPLRSLLQLSRESLDYFTLPTRYDTSNTQRDLAGTGIEVPRFDSYVRQLFAFMRANPHVGSSPMA